MELALDWLFMIIQMEANITREIAFLTLTIVFIQWFCKAEIKWRSESQLWEWKSLGLWKFLLPLGLWRNRSNFITYFWSSEVLRLFCLVVEYKVTKRTVFKFLFPGEKAVRNGRLGGWSKWCKQPLHSCSQHQWEFAMQNVRGVLFSWRDSCRWTGISSSVDISQVIALRRSNLKGWEH